MDLQPDRPAPLTVPAVPIQFTDRDQPTVAFGLSAEPAAESPPTRRKGQARPAPARNDVYDHLSLDALRSYRQLLADEEGKVSYWRRILQARLDVLRAGTNRELDTDRLRPVLTSDRIGAGRLALIKVLPVDDIPPLPSLAELWERRVDRSDTVRHGELERDLAAAEMELSTYRSALHRRIAEATGELISRYREQPNLCLSVLPLGRSGRVSA